MNKKILYCLFSLILIFSCAMFVNAEYIIDKQGIMENLGAGGVSWGSVDVYNDVVRVSTNSDVSTFCIGTTNNVNATTTKCEATGSNKRQKYFGVKNGTYYFWALPYASSGYSNYVAYSKPVTVSSSCTNQSSTGNTGTFVVNRCMTSYRGSALSFDKGGTIACASGYMIDKSQIKVVENGCKSVATTYGGQQLTNAYCNVKLSFTCVPGSGSSTYDPGSGGGSGGSSGGSGGGSGGGSSRTYAKLSSMEVSTGELSPSFSPNTKNYKLTVPADVSTLHVSVASDNGDIREGNEIDFSLDIGTCWRKIHVVHESGTVTTYVIEVTRGGGGSSVSSLSSLTVSAGELSPAFDPETYTYSLVLGTDVNTIDVGAVLADDSSSFDSEFGPRTVNIVDGSNSIRVKVNAQDGSSSIYVIDAYKNGDDESCNETAAERALLKSFKFTYNGEDYDYDLSPEFDSKTMSYSAKVPYKVGNITVDTTTVDEDDNVIIEGGINLEVNVEQTVTIKVESKMCPSISKVYSIGVTRQSQQFASTNADLEDLIIEGHEKEYEFEPNVEVYKIKLNKNEKQLKIKTVTESETTSCEIEGNENLSTNSDVIIRCIAEDDETEAVYTIHIDGVKKGANVFLIVIIIIIIVAVIVYLVLRLMGYKIYFNLGVISAFFNGIAEKIKNMFDK